MTRAAPSDFAAWRDAQPKAEWELPAIESVIEARFRQLALPVALLVAWGAVHAGFPQRLVRIVFSMWIHELGHAVAAWLCGRWAFPGPWLTRIDPQRSTAVVVLVALAIVYGGVRCYRRSKPWLVFFVLLLVAQIYCTFVLSNRKATAFVIWSGDGGAIAIGTLLMLSFYARKTSQLRVGWLRWGFLVIGAAAYADGLATWWAARSDPTAIPFGENEGAGPSDPTVLLMQHGFSPSALVSGYVGLGLVCLGVLLVAYLFGLRGNHKPNEHEPA